MTVCAGTAGFKVHVLRGVIAVGKAQDSYMKVVKSGGDLTLISFIRTT